MFTVNLGIKILFFNLVLQALCWNGNSIFLQSENLDLYTRREVKKPLLFLQINIHVEFKKKY